MPKKKIYDEDTEFLEPEMLEEFVSEESMDEGKAILVTKEGLNQMKEELEYLKTKKRSEVAERLKEAISFGDLSENSEYEDAKNEQAFVEGRIRELEKKIKNAKIISDKKLTTKRVGLGSTVQLKNLSKKGEDEIETYTIVGATETDPVNGKISNESPVGSTLLDKTKGEKFSVVIPKGTVEYQIMKID